MAEKPPKTLTRPAIGTELPSQCLPRCTSYKYRLHYEELSDQDDVMSGNDLYVYFTSSHVEIWHEFEHYSGFELFSDIGGTMGLLMGISLLTIVDVATDVGQKIAAKLKQLCD